MEFKSNINKLIKHSIYFGILIGMLFVFFEVIFLVKYHTNTLLINTMNSIPSWFSSYWIFSLLVILVGSLSIYSISRYKKILIKLYENK